MAFGGCHGENLLILSPEPVEGSKDAPAVVQDTSQGRVSSFPVRAPAVAGATAAAPRRSRFRATPAITRPARLSAGPPACPRDRRPPLSPRAPAPGRGAAAPPCPRPC